MNKRTHQPHLRSLLSVSFLICAAVSVSYADSLDAFGRRRTASRPARSESSSTNGPNEKSLSSRRLRHSHPSMIALQSKHDKSVERVRVYEHDTGKSKQLGTSGIWIRVNILSDDASRFTVQHERRGIRATSSPYSFDDATGKEVRYGNQTYILLTTDSSIRQALAEYEELDREEQAGLVAGTTTTKTRSRSEDEGQYKAQRVALQNISTKRMYVLDRDPATATYGRQDLGICLHPAEGDTNQFTLKCFDSKGIGRILGPYQFQEGELIQVGRQSYKLILNGPLIEQAKMEEARMRQEAQSNRANRRKRSRPNHESGLRGASGIASISLSADAARFGGGRIPSQSGNRMLPNDIYRCRTRQEACSIADRLNRQNAGVLDAFQESGFSGVVQNGAQYTYRYKVIADRDNPGYYLVWPQ